MPQMLLPFFPEEIQLINQNIGYKLRDDKIWYFNGRMPIFHHDKDDKNSFKVFICQLYINGNCSQAELIRAFKLAPASVKRWVKQYREQGPSSFFQQRKGRGPSVLTPEKLQEIQDYLDSGLSVSDISDMVKVNKSTITKAIQQKKLTKKK